MAQEITKLDVFMYFANQLSHERRLELEEATKTNHQVAQWFKELTPTDEELDAECPRKGLKKLIDRLGLTDVVLEDVVDDDTDAVPPAFAQAMFERRRQRERENK